MLRMIQDCILVELPPIPEKIGSIIAVRPKDEKLCEGTIVAVGPGKVLRGVLYPVELEVGQTIMFDHGAGVETEHEGKKYLIMREPHVAMVTDGIQHNTFDDWMISASE